MASKTERTVVNSAGLVQGIVLVTLCISVNTVKTHLKSSYRKLAANRRGKAVRRARQPELI